MNSATMLALNQTFNRTDLGCNPFSGDFGQPPNMGQPSVTFREIFFTIAQFIFGVIGIVGNSQIIMFYQRKNDKTPSEYIILNLGIVDFIYCLCNVLITLNDKIVERFLIGQTGYGEQVQVPGCFGNATGILLAANASSTGLTSGGGEPGFDYYEGGGGEGDTSSMLLRVYKASQLGLFTFVTNYSYICIFIITINRYYAVCKPISYKVICTFRKSYTLLLIALVVSLFTGIVDTYFIYFFCFVRQSQQSLDRYNLVWFFIRLSFTTLDVTTMGIVYYKIATSTTNLRQTLARCSISHVQSSSANRNSGSNNAMNHSQHELTTIATVTPTIGIRSSLNQISAQLTSPVTSSVRSSRSGSNIIGGSQTNLEKQDDIYTPVTTTADCYSPMTEKAPRYAPTITANPLRIENTTRAANVICVTHPPILGQVRLDTPPTTPPDYQTNKENNQTFTFSSTVDGPASKRYSTGVPLTNLENASGVIDCDVDDDDDDKTVIAQNDTLLRSTSVQTSTNGSSNTSVVCVVEPASPVDHPLKHSMSQGHTQLPNMTHPKPASSSFSLPSPGTQGKTLYRSGVRGSDCGPVPAVTPQATSNDKHPRRFVSAKNSYIGCNSTTPGIEKKPSQQSRIFAISSGVGHRTLRRNMTGSNSTGGRGSQRRKSSTENATYALFIISIGFIVFITPYTAMAAWQSFYLESTINNPVHDVLFDLSMLIFNGNFISNYYVYLLFNSVFRSFALSLFKSKSNPCCGCCCSTGQG
ncbi:uncharacterized protein LOC142358686 isoform X2 [Convolutriloba macropyga]|uniref:uncharacterized protein LOC142358686 isoform X2 n=1 Tax=Convolutriloba macropyga TaxID=536237 RepID=UPI003F526CDA